VVKARTWFTLFIVSLGTVAATASCGSDEATGGSSGSGNIISGGGRSGNAGSVGRAGAVGRAGSSGSSSVGDPTSLGLECTSDAQCAEGMVCAKANGTLFGGAGPSKGMCTKACTPTPAGTECSDLKPGAQCFDFGTDDEPQGYCLDACEQDSPLDITSKCAGRTDFVCADLGDEDTGPAPFCVPHCRSDAECGTGLFCDKSSLLGLCSKTKPPAGDPVGAPCTPTTESDPVPNTCAGYCIRTSENGVSPVTGVCVELCSGGSECMYGAGSKPTPGGFCGGALSDPWGALDLGYCLPSCSCTSDCKIEGDLCRKWTDNQSDLAEELGAPGICYPVVAMSVELSCGEGGAGGDGAGGASGAGGDGPGPDTAGAGGSN
jgi:Cys-rich repeat protein